MTKPVLEIDGARFETLEGFFDEAARALISGGPWGRNLDAFNDVLRGGFGTPVGGFVLRWTNSERSRVALGYPETIRVLKQRLERCHPMNVDSVRGEIEAAQRGEGPTMFDVLVEIIREHGEGGSECDDGIELVLA
jgi:hypothetical protein